jgi:parallel beta-helix repeat protein
MRQSLLVFSLFFFFLLFSLSFAKAQEYYISDCSVLNQENATYYLTQDIIDSTSSTCMNIQANNIVLDCQGHTIDGVGGEYSLGVKIQRFPSKTTTNITIKNCILTNWWRGIYIEYSDYNKILNTTVNNNSESGIFVDVSDYITIDNATMSYNGYCGIWISGGNTTITNSIFKLNFYGIRIDDSPSNNIFNNLFNNTYNFFFSGTIYTNYWNTTKQIGTRIYSYGNEIGGNYWSNPDGNGYSDTCEDSDKDGFCDQPYDLLGDGSNVDYLPLSDEYSPPCIEPHEGMVIDKDTTFCRGTYYLNFTTIESRIKFSNPNVKVYCNETVFIGNNTPDSIAIMVDRDNVTITKTDDASFGCKFSNYRFGINTLSSNALVEYVDIDNIEENGEAGVFVGSGTNFTIRHIRGYNSRETVDVRGIGFEHNYGTVYDVYCHNITGWGCVVTGFNPPQNLTLNLGDVTCEDSTTCVSIVWANDLALNCFGLINGNGGGVGIYVKESSGNLTIENCTVANSTIGIQVENSDSTTIKDSKVYYSSQSGISIFGGSNNLLENIETYYTAPESAGLALNTENTVLRSIYTHDEYRSVLGGTNNTLEYSRCENVSWGCWHIFGNNTTVRHNYFPNGIGLFGSSYGRIYNNTIGDGIGITDWFGVGSSHNEIYNNYISRYECGIYFVNSGDNLIYNNIINTSQTPVCFGDTVYANQWNTARRSGTRIYSNGTEIGGNYWTNPDGTGYSDTCEDSNKDGFCDQPYVLAENNTDYLPLSDEYMPFAPAPRLYQLSPIAGILAYVLLPIVFALVAQKYLLGEVELTLQGLIKYLLMFVMVIIIAIGFALVFSII